MGSNPNWSVFYIEIVVLLCQQSVIQQPADEIQRLDSIIGVVQPRLS